MNSARNPRLAQGWRSAAGRLDSCQHCTHARILDTLGGDRVFHCGLGGFSTAALAICASYRVDEPSVALLIDAAQAAHGNLVESRA